MTVRTIDQSAAGSVRYWTGDPGSSFHKINAAPATETAMAIEATIHLALRLDAGCVGFTVTGAGAARILTGVKLISTGSPVRKSREGAERPRVPASD